jgi:hypothetical protein
MKTTEVFVLACVPVEIPAGHLPNTSRRGTAGAILVRSHEKGSSFGQYLFLEYDVDFT